MHLRCRACQGRYACARRRKRQRWYALAIRLPSALTPIPLESGSRRCLRAPSSLRTWKSCTCAWSAFPAATPDLARHIRFNPLLVPEALRAGVAAGYVDYTPAHFHQISSLFAEGPRKLDVAVVSVAPPTADGTCSYGAYVGFMEQACRVARTVIAEVNERMPQTYGPARLPLAYADAVIATDYLLPENPRPVLTDVERQLGANVAALIRDGDCLQVGGGAVPAAVAECLTDRQDLGIHTELCTDWMVDLIERVAVSPAPAKISTRARW